VISSSVGGATTTASFEDGHSVEVRTALPSYVPVSGDRVLVTIDERGDAWVIGVIERSVTPLLDEALEAADPAHPANDPVTRVHDRRGRLLFEYDPGVDRAVLHVPEGDLELQVPNGKLEMSARDGVELRSEASVCLSSGEVVELRAEREVPVASVKVRPGEIVLVGSALSAAADRVEVLAHRFGFSAHLVESRVDRAKHVVRVLETRAGRIVERAGDVYREVERLSQTRAGRLNLVAKKAAQLVGENTLIKARDRMKVKGERIHLA